MDHHHSIHSLTKGYTPAVLLAFVLGLSMGSVPAQAAVTTVNTTDDELNSDGDCSLREAIRAANLNTAVDACLAGSDTDTDEIRVPTGTFTLTRSGFDSDAQNGDLDVANNTVTEDLIITGASADLTIIQACPVHQRTVTCPTGQGIAERVFDILSGATVTIADVTIRNGNSAFPAGGGVFNSGTLTLVNTIVRDNRTGSNGGGIYNASTLTVTNSHISNNNADFDGGGLYNTDTMTLINSTVSSNSSPRGGGIWGESGTLTVISSTVSDNNAGGPDAAGHGAGIFNWFGAILTLTNSTVSGNSAGGNGGGVVNNGTLTVSNSTITNNGAGIRGGDGGGIYSSGGTASLRNTILAGNFVLTPDSFSPAVDCFRPLASGPLTSQGFNLLGDGTACSGLANGVNGDQVGTAVAPIDPKLGLLAPNGGPTTTHALGTSSPAIDAGNPALPGSEGFACEPIDQRGIERPQGSRCDIGAFELGEAGFSLFAIRPNRAGNTGSVLALIYGTGFVSGASAKLVRTGQPDIDGKAATVGGNGTVIVTTFDLTGKTPGLRDVVVTNPDSTSVTLAGAFTIAERGAPRVWVDVIGRSTIRVARRVTYFILYGNRGEVDAFGVPLTISLPREFAFSLDTTPPPPHEAQLPTNWAQIPIATHAEGQTGRTYIPLLLPVVPTGFTGVLRLTLTAPQQGSFNITFGIGEPYFRPDLDPEVVASFIQEAHKYAHRVFGTVTFPPNAVLEDYLAAQLHAVVALGSDSWVDSLGTQPQVYSSSQLMIDLARFAAVQAEASSQSAVSPSLAHGQRDRNEIVATEWIDSLSRLFVSTFLQISQVQVQAPPPEEPPDLPFCDPQSFSIVPCEPPPPPPDDPPLPCDMESFSLAPCTPPPGCLADGYFWPGLPCDPDDLDGDVLRAVDPNDKVGSLGAGHFLAGEEPLRYVIYFENLESASAPAQEVVITDQLDVQRMDFDTFSFGPMSFGSHMVVPPPGLSQFTTDVALRNLICRIDASLDPTTGLLTWRLTSIDPDTGELPEESLAGCLPPNKNSPEGEGSVLFTVQPKPGLATGTQICNQAGIVFDVNAPLVTPEWCNTLDTTPPQSQVQALVATQSSSRFEVQWAGSDQGSGIADYTIFVSENGGPFTPFVSDTTDTSAVFTGELGKTYAFYSVARDLVGNEEAPPTTADTTTLIGGLDQCPNDPNKTEPGACGCGVADTDTDGDGAADCQDACPADVNKTAAGACGCGVADTDSDSDGTPDCNDQCPVDANKTILGACGCGVAGTDTDGDGAADCNDACPNDANKTAAGGCGCGVADTDSDGDGTPDCNDQCPADPAKVAPGACGCGIPDTACQPPPPVDACTPTAILDTFNRPDGSVGNNWRGTTGTSFYRIAGNRLDVQAGGPIYWNPTAFGTSQAAFVTLSSVDPRSPSHGILLKVQSGSVPNAGAIAVVYDAVAKAVRVSALRLGTLSWTPYGNTSVLFTNGDKLGACAKENGEVRVYKNDALVKTVTLTAADQGFFNPKGGKVGVWAVLAPQAFLDDFGGATLAP